MLMVKDVSLALRQTTLLHNVNFSVQPGEILTLMGPSGSGKSSLFAWMAGALPGDFRAAGELWINTRRCDALPTEQRGLGLLFQDALLFDHFSVGQNLLLSATASVVRVANRPLPSHRVGRYCAMLTENPTAKAVSAGRIICGHLTSQNILSDPHPRVRAIRIRRGSSRRQAGCITSSIHGNTHSKCPHNIAIHCPSSCSSKAS